jgi:hypothetical protein
VALFTERAANGFAAAALPDDSVVERLAGRAVEDEDGFALVRDAEAGETGQAVTRGEFAHDGKCVLPDFFGIVLDPSGLGIELAVVAGGFVEHRTLAVKEDGFGGGGALVKGEEDHGAYAANGTYGAPRGGRASCVRGDRLR